jgi:hypothetical protein
MLGLDTLDVVIGLAFLFFILSLVVSAAREMIEGWMQTRAVHLERGMRELLRDETGENLASQVYNHPLINSLFRGKYDPAKDLKSRGRLARLISRHDEWKRYANRSNLPSYIPARNFALALLDLSARGNPEAAGAGPATVTFQQVRSGVARHITDPTVQRVVLVALDSAKGDLERARANLENWFDSGMDRVSGWYRKQTQWILFGLGLFAAVVLNVDTIRVSQALYQDAALRAAIVSEVQATVERAASNPGDDSTIFANIGCSEPSAEARRSCAEERLERLGYPIGWNFGDDSDAGDFRASSIPGWLLTALAITLGAPFWFDILNKVMVIRSTVKPHEKSPEEASEDRQPRTIATPASQTVAQPQRQADQVRPPGDPAADPPDPEFVPHTWDDPTNPDGGDL